MALAKGVRMALRILLPVACIYLVALAGLFFRQRRMIYFPDKLPLNVARSMADHAGFQDWQNSAGEHIGWKKLSNSTDSRIRVLITHGNAGSAIDRYDYANAFESAAGCDVYILEYPGYGPRPGPSTEASLFAAGDEAVGLITGTGPLIVMGESLGTGVAAYLAGAHPQQISGVLLISPYYSLGEVAQTHMPLFPAKFMLRDKFDSGKYLRNFHGPVAVVLAELDTVVPARFGQKLYDAYSGPKELWIVPKADHNVVPNVPKEWWHQIVTFLSP
jgi:uncharacterized protein